MTQRHEVGRESDGELLGFVASVAGGWVPTTVFGAPLGGATCDREDAEGVVRATGLSSLADSWEFIDVDGDAHTAHIVEASTSHVTLILGHYFPDPATRFTIAAPVGGELRRR